MIRLKKQVTNVLLIVAAVGLLVLAGCGKPAAETQQAPLAASELPTSDVASVEQDIAAVDADTGADDTQAFDDDLQAVDDLPIE